MNSSKEIDKNVYNKYSFDGGFHKEKGVAAQSLDGLVLSGHVLYDSHLFTFLQRLINKAQEALGIKTSSQQIIETFKTYKAYVQDITAESDESQCDNRLQNS
jgi:hypothetical protein